MDKVNLLYKTLFFISCIIGGIGQILQGDWIALALFFIAGGWFMEILRECW